MHACMPLLHACAATAEPIPIRLPPHSYSDSDATAPLGALVAWTRRSSYQRATSWPSRSGGQEVVAPMVVWAGAGSSMVGRELLSLKTTLSRVEARWDRRLLAAATRPITPAIVAAAAPPTDAARSITAVTGALPDCRLSATACPTLFEFNPGFTRDTYERNLRRGAWELPSG